jgi:hypothetical protein
MDGKAGKEDPAEEEEEEFRLAIGFVVGKILVLY